MCVFLYAIPDKVSVQIATYNRPSLLLEALHQIEVQDYAGQIEALMLK